MNGACAGFNIMTYMKNPEILAADQVSLSASIMAIGAFDGVHRGHQHLIRRAVAAARQAGCPALVWTFDPPPKVVFGRAEQLCSLSEKLNRIAHLGPDIIVLARFDADYAKRSATAFLGDLARVNPSEIHVGSDFRFGHRQSGDVALLAEHFPVTIPEPYACARGEIVSSTRIRALRAEGRLEEAQALLGPLHRAAPTSPHQQAQNL